MFHPKVIVYKCLSKDKANLASRLIQLPLTIWGNQKLLLGLSKIVMKTKLNQDTLIPLFSSLFLGRVRKQNCV